MLHVSTPPACWESHILELAIAEGETRKEKPDLFLEAHGSDGFAFHNLKLGTHELVLQLRCQIISIFQKTLAIFLEHSHMWCSVTFSLYNAQVVESHVPAIDGTLSNPEVYKSPRAGLCP